MINLTVKTDVEKLRISKAPTARVFLFEGASTERDDDILIERVELRHYQEGLDKEKGAYSLITAYLKSSKGEIELKFDEGFKGKDPLPEISLNLKIHIGLEQLINRLLIALDET